MTDPLRVITLNLPSKFLRETLHRPWMRLFIFLEDGPLARTPEHYKKFFYDWRVKLPMPVNTIPEPGKWKVRHGTIAQVQNIQIPLLHPYELHKGLWGGEGVIRGFEKRKLRRRKVAHYWVPRLEETVVYSEIFDKYLRLTVTPRALNLIDQYYGLDNYILQSEPADLMSELALRLRREMIYNLLHKTIYPDNPDKKEEIYNKYKQHIIPEEEIDWYGLNLREATRKQLKLEAAAAQTGPYKNIFRKEFIEYLKQNPGVVIGDSSQESSGKGILQKLNIFGSRK